MQWSDLLQLKLWFSCELAGKYLKKTNSGNVDTWLDTSGRNYYYFSPSNDDRRYVTQLSISESLLKLNGRCWSEGTFICLYYACLVKWLQHLLLDEDFARVTSVSKPEKLQHGSMLYVELQRKGTELSADSELSWPFIKQNSPLIAQLRSNGL